MEYKRVHLTEAQERATLILDAMLSLLMSVEEVFTSPGLGTVVTGFQEIGSVYEGEQVTLIHRDGEQACLTVKEVIHYKGEDETCPAIPSSFVSVRFDTYKKEIFRDGDVLADWRSAWIIPGGPEDDLWDY